MIEALDREIKKAEEGRVYKEGLSTVILEPYQCGKIQPSQRPVVGGTRHCDGYSRHH